MPSGATNGLAPCHTRIIIRGNWKALNGGRRTLGSEVGVPAAMQSSWTPDTYASAPESGCK